MRLLVFSGVHHYYQKGQIFAHGGFVNEMEIWARLFDEVLVIAPKAFADQKGDDIPYKSSGISLFPLCSVFDSNGLTGKVRLLLSAPSWLIKSLKIIKPGDVIMARGPDSIGFLGYLVSRFKSNKHFAKYADQWQNFKGEPLGYRLQKIFYRSKLFGGLVQIYGKDDQNRSHLIPFFTSSITRSQWHDADPDFYIKNRPHDPFRLLFVGRLVYAKGVDVILKALQILIHKGYNVTFTIAGDGEEQERLISLSNDLQLSNLVSFVGRLGWDQLKQIYQDADVFVHASRKEGFGKVLLEAMTYALPIIATDVGVTMKILSPTQYGYVIEPDDVGLLVHRLEQIITDYSGAQVVGENARAQVAHFFLDDLEAYYREFLKMVVLY